MASDMCGSLLLIATTYGTKHNINSAKEIHNAGKPHA